ncbi:MAG: hypothetical protein H6737_22400 [Alphaproteobacteria bacterium]|nr:hypothetical protein [Alphaproteobacteria bacterium]
MPLVLLAAFACGGASPIANPLTGTRAFAVQPDEQVCAVDDDCVLLALGCCSCEFFAVNGEHRVEVRDRYPSDEGIQCDCPRCERPPVACDAGTCVVRPLPEASE